MTVLVDQLTEIFLRHRRWVVLTGAGISAPSGIPTYRDADGRWLRSRPIQHQEFLSSPAHRQRYWGRSMIGWPAVRDAQPNGFHDALTRLEVADRTELIVTQNVDRLHQRSGSQSVIDLHGRLDRVVCLDCGAGYTRETVQEWLLRLNPQHRQLEATARPDGDADLSDSEVAGIRSPQCEACGGMVMPDVVFFGGAIPRDRVERCERAVEAADGLLVVGSSLQVYSGFRLCKQAAALDKPLVIVNEGHTRADTLTDMKIDTDALPVLASAIDRIIEISPEHAA